MEDGLVLSELEGLVPTVHSLNPCCDGRWSRTIDDAVRIINEKGLNPCCDGRWSRTRPYKTILIINKLKNSTKQFFTFLNRKLTFP